jgi:predicted secreted protein
MATLKGQNFRICIYDSTATKYKVIGMATGCTVTLTNNTESGTHKDVVGSADMPVTVSKSWSVSCDSLNVADAAAMLTAIKSMEPMTLM